MPEPNTLVAFFDSHWMCDPLNMNDELVSVVDFVLVVWPHLLTTGRARAAISFLQAIERAVEDHGQVPLFIDKRVQRTWLDNGQYPNWAEQNASSLSSAMSGFEAALCAVIFAREFEVVAAQTAEEQRALSTMADTVMSKLQCAMVDGLLPGNSAFVANGASDNRFPTILSTQVLLQHAQDLQGEVKASCATRHIINQLFWDNARQTYNGALGRSGFLDPVGIVLSVLHNIGGGERSRATMACLSKSALLSGGALISTVSPYRHVHATHLGNTSAIVLPTILSLTAIAFAEVHMDVEAESCICCLHAMPLALLWLHPESGRQAEAPSAVAAAAILLATNAVCPNDRTGDKKVPV